MRSLLAFLSALLVLGALHTPALADVPLPSIHQRELERHRNAPIPKRTKPDPLQVLAGKDKALSRIVYGYLPFWADSLATIRWNSLTHIAWFAVEINSNGTVVAQHGWPDEEAVAVAHDAGVRVDLTITLFSGTGIRHLVTTPSARAEAIDNMIAQMELGGADGLSIDFEGFIDGTRDGFTTFVGELRDELDARGLEDKEITLAGPSVDWAGEWDVAALLERADYFFIMGYAYFYGGSSHAGPTGILRISDDWRGLTGWSALRSVATYASRVSPEQRRQILYGVPYYGEEWTTTSSTLAAETIDHVGAVTYNGARKDLSEGMTRLWDDGSKTPWYRYNAGGWRQVYYDDEESLAHKYRLATDEDLGGVGMWALNYDSSHDELWDLLDTWSAETPSDALGHRNNPIAIEAFPFSDDRDTSAGPSQYFNYYACADETPEYGREWIYRLDVCQPGTLTANVDGALGTDPDVHLLSELREDACIARGHLGIEVPLGPGRYHVIVDTFVASGVELEGPYTLDVDFVPDAGTEGCADHLVCAAGDCVCPLAGQSSCDGACVDLATDEANCGACGNACDGTTCVSGACTDTPCTGAECGTGGAGPGNPSRADDTGAAASCGCRVTEDSKSEGVALSLLIALAWAGRRRRS